MKTAFAGLGIMGRPMAINLIKGGHPLACWARRAESMTPVVDAGGVACSLPAEVARGADVIFVMVSDSQDVEQVILGPGGVIEGAAPGSVVVDMSTISPVVTRAIAAKLREKGIEMLDAPVSGGDVGAIAGTLSIMVGGKPDVFARVKPLFDCMGKNIVHIGDTGAGQVAKACNQIVAAVTLEAVAEALTLARRLGVDPGRVRQALLGGFAWSKVLEIHGGRMLSRNFQPGFKAALHAKDLNIVMQTAYHYGLALPQSALIAQHLNALVGGGDGEIDSAAVVKVIERSAGERITAPLASTEPVNADASVDGTAGARPTVGFIGLGAMGRPMALNLMKAGYELAVWSRRPESAQSVVDAGATRCDSPAEVARRSDVIFTMVMAGPDVESVVLGEQGIAEGAKPGSIVIDCSTIPPDTVRRIAARLRERQIEFIDAPVSGGEVGAAAGTLSIMAGGSKAAYERALPLLSTFGKTLIHVGETGSGQAAKAANQLVLVVSIHGIAEAMAFAAANDVPFEPVWTALMKGFAGSRMLEVFGPRMMNRQFEAGLDAALHHKDSHIVLECAAASKTPVPGLALAAQAFNALMGRPGTRWDSAALRLVVSDTQGRV